MQFNKITYIASLVWRKYKLPYFLVAICTLLFFAVLELRWAEIKLNFELDLPFLKTTVPSASIDLKGWEIMGYFGLIPFLPMLLILTNRFKKTAWIFTVAIMPVSILYTLNIFGLIGRIYNEPMDFVVLSSQIYLPFYLYFGLIALLILFTYQISKNYEQP
jgi:hypothetical protein